MKMRAVKSVRTASRRLGVPAILMAAACLAGAPALAGPPAPHVVTGVVDIQQQGNLLTITNTPGAILEWQRLSIGPDEIMHFIQQGPNSAVLNRVVGQDPTQILGVLQSNGRVFLINPNGIAFGHGAQVNVNGLVASTLGLSNADFKSGSLRFDAGATAGSIANMGAITTPMGGHVYLIAPNIQNNGIITSPQGEVLLAAGRSVQLLDSANPDMIVALSAPEDQAINLGEVIAKGGSIGIHAALINQRGVINADSAVVGENGRIVLKASHDTLLEAGSATSATGAGRGGDIQILGQRVGVTGDARVDASGQSGGGSVLIGGDYQGANPAIPNAQRAFIGRDALISADALDSGDGGTVVVWSDEATRAHGRITARGGASGGDGGLVETSGHYLDVAGIRVDASAASGRSGDWLLDPTDIEVIAGGGDALSSVDEFADPGEVTTIDSDLISSALANVSLQATNNITFSSGVDIVAANVGLTALAGNNIYVNSPITTNGGSVALVANTPGFASGAGSIFTEGPITTNGGGISLAGARITAASLRSGGGAIDLQSESDISLVGEVDAGTGDVKLLAAEQITAVVPIPIVANTLQMTASGGIGDGNGGALLTQVKALNASNSGSGDVIVSNSGGNLSIVDLGGYGIQQSGGGILWLASDGAIGGDGLVSADTLSLQAVGGISLQTNVAMLSAANADSGDISIDNAGPLALGRVEQLPGAAVNSGAIVVQSAGAMTLDESAYVATDSGDIALTSQGRLDVSGTVASNSGAINLTATGSGVPDSGDDLSIYGSVTSTSGDIRLSAGDAIVINPDATVLSTTGVVTQTPNLNVPPPPTLNACIADPMLAGCDSVLPTMNQCIASPALPGCSVVLPSVGACIANPTAPGCSVVLPSLGTCVATPTTAGCSVVLPSLSMCIVNPSTPGCGAVLPSLVTCTANPSASGCSVVLPSLTSCTVNPSAPGCSVVLPSLASCTANPSASGCSAVLPSPASCTANPSASGCGVVLPSLASCTVNPSAPGCSVVLPTLSQCVAAPTLAGCSAVLPTVNQCVAAPTLQGCSFALPPTQQVPDSPIDQASNCVINSITTGSTLTDPGSTANMLVMPSSSDDTAVAGVKTGDKQDVRKKTYCN
ncbi:filamentous hemagglutinin N-terminal domain-containing protein [Halopseudomonas laoshanensis]|uniref:two-partner secretion domain-containing protein n=1 Tax=Halopseudomonas laoshanensis TaxID=2268758 RepID=UPI003736C209